MEITELIMGKRFRELARYSVEDNGRVQALSKKAGGVVVYSNTHSAYKAFEFIENMPEKEVILVTHNSDECIGTNEENSEFLPHIDIKYCPDKVVKWYAQNVTDTVDDERIIPIPIGLENDHILTGIQKPEKILEAYRNRHFAEKKKLLYVNHNVSTNPQKRQAPYLLYNSVPWATTIHGRNGSNFDEYLRDLQEHKFVLSPPGNGLDCHRTWEAIYAGCIPIVHEMKCYTNHFSRYYPIIIAKTERLYEKDLESNWNLLEYEIKQDLQYLKMSYWERRIYEAH